MRSSLSFNQVQIFLQNWGVYLWFFLGIYSIFPQDSPFQFQKSAAADFFGSTVLLFFRKYGYKTGRFSRIMPEIFSLLFKLSGQAFQDVTRFAQLRS